MAITIEQLAPRYYQYLRSDLTSLKNLRLASRYKLEDDKLSEMASIIARAYLQEFELEKLPELIKAELGLNDALAFLLAADMAKQHFANHPEYLDYTDEVADQWSVWGRQLGGRQPRPKGSPEIEKIIAEANKPVIAVGLNTELANKKRIAKSELGRVEKEKENNTSFKREPNVATKSAGVVDLRTAGKQSEPGQMIEEPPVKSVEDQRSGSSLGRQQFLKRVNEFSIDKMRPEGQSAAGRLTKVTGNIQKVVSQNPGDKPAIAEAFKRSDLFRQYQEIGRSVSQTGKSLDQVIYDRYEAKKPYLLKDEFEAVAGIIKVIQ